MALASTITAFDISGASTASYAGTFPQSINTAGAITGYFTDTNNVFRGFVRAANGTVFPAPGTNASQETTAGSISDTGMITGSYRDTNSLYHGFIWMP